MSTQAIQTPKIINNSNIPVDPSQDFPPIVDLPVGYPLKHLEQIYSGCDLIDKKVEIEDLEPELFNNSLRSFIYLILKQQDAKICLDLLKEIKTADQARDAALKIGEQFPAIKMYVFILLSFPELLDVPLVQIFAPVFKKKMGWFSDRIKNKFPLRVVRDDQSVIDSVTSTMIFSAPYLTSKKEQNDALEDIKSLIFGSKDSQSTIIQEMNDLPNLFKSFQAEKFFGAVPSMEPPSISPIAEFIIRALLRLRKGLTDYKKNYQDFIESSVEATMVNAEANKIRCQAFIPYNKDKIRKTIEATDEGLQIKTIINKISRLEKIIDKLLPVFSVLLETSGGNAFVVSQSLRRLLESLYLPIREMQSFLLELLKDANQFRNETQTPVKPSTNEVKYLGDWNGCQNLPLNNLKQCLKEVCLFRLVFMEMRMLLFLYNPNLVDETLSQHAYEQLLIELSEQKPKLKKERVSQYFPPQYEPSESVTFQVIGSITKLLGPKLHPLYTSLCHEKVDSSVLEEIIDHVFFAAQGIELFHHLASKKKNVFLPFHFFMIDLYVCVEQFLTAKILVQGKVPDVKHSLLVLAKQSGLTFTDEQKQFFKTFDQALLQARYPEEYKDQIFYPLSKKLRNRPTADETNKAYQIMVQNFKACQSLLFDEVTFPNALKDCSFEQGNDPLYKTSLPSTPLTFYQLIQKAMELRKEKELKPYDFYLLRGLFHTDKLIKHLCASLCTKKELDPIPTHNLEHYFEILNTVGINPFNTDERALLKSINIGIAQHYHTLLDPLLTSRDPKEIEQTIHKILTQLVPKLIDF